VLAHPQHRRHALRHHNHLERRFHHRWGRGVARPHLRGQAYSYGAGTPGHAAAVPPGYAAPGAVYRPGVAAPAAGARGRACNCAPCPTCGVSAAQGSTAQNATPTPAYCRCCGQVLR
jgi:hypothetical protein